ncbi:PH domain-containing protein [Candidatus Harpocratesius sp.]
MSQQHLNIAEKNRLFDNIMRENSDLRNPKAEKNFFSNETFRNEIKFEPGEKLFYLNYQNWFIVVVFNAIPLIITIALLLFGFFKLKSKLFELDSFELVILLIIIVIFLLIYGIPIVMKFIQSKSYRYIITDRRIIVGYTFLQRWTRIVEYSNIVDVVVHQPFFLRLFRSGNVLLITASNEGPYIRGSAAGTKGMMNNQGFMKIKYPFRIKRMIRQIMHVYTEKHASPPPLLSLPLKNPIIKHPDELKVTKKEHLFKIYEKKRSSSLIKGIMAWLAIPFYFILNMRDLRIILALGSSFFQWIGIILLSGIILIIIFSKYHAKGFEFAVTDRRIIMMKKFLDISIRDVIMGKITDVSIFQMAAGRVANFGVIYIGTKGFERMIRFRDLYHIQGVADVVKEKEDIRNMVLYFQRGQLYSPELEFYDPEFLNL